LYFELLGAALTRRLRLWEVDHALRIIRLRVGRGARNLPNAVPELGIVLGSGVGLALCWLRDSAY
jgi:hypothetical protein